MLPRRHDSRTSLQYSTMQYIDGPKQYEYREMFQLSYAWSADPIYPM